MEKIVNKKIMLFVILVMVVLNIILATSYIKKKKNIDNYFRLHITANSNSLIDQQTKMQVSEAVNNYLKCILVDNNYDKQTTKNIIKENIDELLLISNNIVANSRCSYPVSLKYGNIYYTKRNSESYYMDEGIYDSVEIVLGKGKGKNFWSLLYPFSFNLSCETESNNTNLTYNDLTKDDIKYESFFINCIKKIFKK